MTRLLPVIFLALLGFQAQGAVYRGRVQYASSGKLAAKVLVEARSYSGPNLLFWIPRESHTVLATVSTGADGGFAFQLPDHTRRLRFAARGSFSQGGHTCWYREIAPSPGGLHTIILPDDFRPWRLTLNRGVSPKDLTLR